MRMTMTTTIRGTVVTSSNSTVRELKPNEVSPIYSEFQQEVCEDLLRFNFPKDYTIKLGCQYDIDKVCLYKDGDTLVFSVLGEPLGDHIFLRPFLWNPNKNPLTKILDEYEDEQFYCVPKYYAEPFTVGSDIVYRYVHETEDRERHVTCQIESL